LSPAPRWGHAFGIFPNTTLLFGGMGTQGPLSDMYALYFSSSDQNSNQTAMWNQIVYNYDNNSNVPITQIQSLYEGVAISITQTDGIVTFNNFILYGGFYTATSDNTAPNKDTCVGCIYVYNIERNVVSVIRPNGTAPQAYPLVAVTTTSGLYFNDGEKWTRFSSGICSDGILSIYEECDDSNDDFFDNCEMCYIELCGNDVVDPGEDCDGGPLCTDYCTCPKPFFSDGGTRNGCIPAPVAIAYVFMIIVPVLISVALLGVVINIVTFTRKTNQSIVKVLFM